MNCKEKFLKEHPGFADNIDLYCPSDFNYMSDPEYCSQIGWEEFTCEKCWNRELKELKGEENMNYIKTTKCGDTKEELRDIGEMIRDLVEAKEEIKKRAECEEATKGLKLIYDSLITAGFSPEISGQILIAYISKPTEDF